MQIKTLFVFLIAIVATSCADNKKSETLFERLSTSYTGIDFENSITPTDSINILNYEYLYNGGGIGVGDFNNDNLPDVFFTGNLVESKLYINKSEMHFDDITSRSGINTSGKWCTGVSIIDINQDGFDDIYISVGGMGNKSSFPNLLYINNGDLTFTESAVSYGLADQGESIQAVFFDYDLDGDLDMYLLTGGGFEKSAIQLRPIMTNGTSRNTDRLYRNDYNVKLGHPVYTDVSSEAGITIEGFGLGIAVIDANNDSWPDLYISNDYLSRDLLYVNQKDGRFQEKGLEVFGHVSHFSMGNDVADINNDGYTDLITVDMLPEDLKRRKLMAGANSYDLFQIALRYGYGNQFMRNMLQRNNANGTYSEIGQLAGIDKTDWSWAPLLADFDNDGLNDLFVTNGFGKDITDMDFVKFRERSGSSFRDRSELQKSVKDCLVKRPAINIANYAFKNQGNLKFEKTSRDWGFEEPSISSGAIYADFDNDGDLDLMVSNINEPAFIYRNTLNDSLSGNTNYLKIYLEGSEHNKKGIGAQLTVYTGDSKQVRFNNPVRGFQSTVSTTLHFGLNTAKAIDSVEVIWPDGRRTIQKSVSSNQELKFYYEDSKPHTGLVDNQAKIFYKHSGIQFKHEDRFYNDYATQPLLMRGYSNQGPGLAAGDLNGDGLEDLFVGGSYGFNSTILYQTKTGTFTEATLPETEVFEDISALIFDANRDGRMDIYVTSGGSERYAGHEAYQDRLYLNTAKGWEKGELPPMFTSTSTVAAADFDQDGDLDLFVGGRMVPGKFPEHPQSYLLENIGGVFTDVTSTFCPVLKTVGMVTAAIFSDYDDDNLPDLILAGEFMPLTILKNTGKKFKNITKESGLEHSSGLWNSLVAEDFDGDGDIDFVAGNLGLNTFLTSDSAKPLKVDYADFDINGYVDPIFSKYEEGNYYPLATLDQLTQQLPKLKKNFLYYHSFAKATTAQILQYLKTPHKTLLAEELRTSYIENLGNGRLQLKALPREVQIAPVNAIVCEDLNADGLLDLIMVGNNYNTEVNGGRYDASFGNVLINNGNGNFKSIPGQRSGFTVYGDAKSLVKFKFDSKDLMVVGINSGELNSFEIKPLK